MNTLLTESLWRDESFSAVISQESFVDIIKIISRDTSPPLYDLLQRIWFMFFSNSEVSIRMMSVLFTIITAYYAYKIASHLFNKQAAIFASVLTLVHPLLFLYAFEGRMYALLSATITASMYYFLTENKNKYILATTLALYTHYFALLVLFSQAVYFLGNFFINKKFNKKIFISGIIIAILYLPWVYPIYYQTSQVTSGFWLSTPTLKDLQNLIYDYMGYWANNPYSELTFFLISLISIYSVIKNKSKSVFLLIWFFVPIFTNWIVSQLIQPIFLYRYLIASIPALSILISASVSDLRKELRWIIYVLIIIIIALFVNVDRIQFFNPEKQDFRSFANYVRASDAQLINWPSSLHYWESKYYELDAPLYIPDGVDVPFYFGTALLKDEDIISEIDPTTQKLGVILSNPDKIIEIEGFGEVERENIDGIIIVWLQRN